MTPDVMNPSPNVDSSMRHLSGPDVCVSLTLATVSGVSSRMPSTSLMHAAYMRESDAAFVMPLAAGISAACIARVLKIISSPVTANAPSSDSARPTRLSGPMNCAIISTNSGGGGDDGTSGATRDSSLAGNPIQKSSPRGVRDFLGKERTDRLPRDATYELTGEVAVGQRVVPVRGAGLPDRLLRRERLDQRRPGEDLLGGELAIDHRKASPMRHHEVHGHVGLARRRELGPVVGDLRVVVDLTPLREERNAHGSRALGRREHELERAVVVRPAGGGVGDTAPQVDDLAPVHVQRDLRSELAVLGEVADERVAHGLEAGLDSAADSGSGDVGHAASTISRI